MSIPTPTELEQAADHADRLAGELEAQHGKRGQLALFARALRTTARNIRLALVAEAPHEVALRLYLRLEGTIRRAEQELLVADAPPSSRRVEEIPASQRPTVPPPRAHRPEQLFALTDDHSRPTRPPPAASQMRMKSVEGAPTKKAEGSE